MDAALVLLGELKLRRINSLDQVDQSEIVEQALRYAVWIPTATLVRHAAHIIRIVVPSINRFSFMLSPVIPSVFSSDSPSIREGITMRSCLIWASVASSIVFSNSQS